MSTKDAIRFGCPRDHFDRRNLPEDEPYITRKERELQDIACGNTATEFQNNLTSFAAESVNDMKESVGSVASATGEKYQNVANKASELGKPETYENAAERLHGMVAGEDTLAMEQELNRDPDKPLSDEDKSAAAERRQLDGDHGSRIDDMDHLQLENYLREKHISSAPDRQVKK